MTVPRVSRKTQCTSKHTYTKAEAKRAVKRSMNHGKGVMKAYRCPHCNAWHIGHVTDEMAVLIQRADETAYLYEGEYASLSSAVAAATEVKGDRHDPLYIYKSEHDVFVMDWERIVDSDEYRLMGNV